MIVKIANREIGEGNPCFIIAEAGVNHNGDVNLARKLIAAAKEAGADAVKFQTFTAEAITTRGAEKAAYQKESTGQQESQFEMLKKLELSVADHRLLKEYADQMGIIFLSTPYDNDSVDLLVELGVPAFKVSSADITNLPLLKHIVNKDKPVILSTGMATLGEIEEALGAIREGGVNDIVLLHCISAYPARTEDINLRMIETLGQTFNLPVGLSDHAPGIVVPVAAVALGACALEKHFTLDKNLVGPDHRASLEPEGLKQMVTAIKDVEKALGNGIKRLTAEEAANKRAIRRSIVAAADIPEGAAITEEMLAMKRPGTGIKPKWTDSIIGLRAKRHIKKDELLDWDSVR